MSNIILGTYNGTDIFYDPDTEEINLTALWKAAGGVENQAPKYWLRQEGTQKLLIAVGKRLNVISNHLYHTRRGKHGGGTWSYRHIGISYAMYLDPDLHAQCLEWIDQVIQNGGVVHLSLTAQEQARLDGVPKRRLFTDALQQVNRPNYGKATNSLYSSLTSLDAHGLRAKTGAQTARDGLNSLALGAIAVIEEAASFAIEKRNVTDMNEAVQIIRQLTRAQRVMLEAAGVTCEQAVDLIAQKIVKLPAVGRKKKKLLGAQQTSMFDDNQK